MLNGICTVSGCPVIGGQTVLASNLFGSNLCDLVQTTDLEFSSIGDNLHINLDEVVSSIQRISIRNLAKVKSIVIGEAFASLRSLTLDQLSALDDLQLPNFSRLNSLVVTSCTTLQHLRVFNELDQATNVASYEIRSLPSLAQLNLSGTCLPSSIVLSDLPDILLRVQADQCQPFVNNQSPFFCSLTAQSSVFLLSASVVIDTSIHGNFPLVSMNKYESCVLRSTLEVFLGSLTVLNSTLQQLTISDFVVKSELMDNNGPRIMLFYNLDAVNISRTAINFVDLSIKSPLALTDVIANSVTVNNSASVAVAGGSIGSLRLSGVTELSVQGMVTNQSTLVIDPTMNRLSVVDTNISIIAVITSNIPSALRSLKMCSNVGTAQLTDITLFPALENLTWCDAPLPKASDWGMIKLVTLDTLRPVNSSSVIDLSHIKRSSFMNLAINNCPQSDLILPARSAAPALDEIIISKSPQFVPSNWHVGIFDDYAEALTLRFASAIPSYVPRLFNSARVWNMVSFSLSAAHVYRAPLPSRSQLLSAPIAKISATRLYASLGASATAACNALVRLERSQTRPAVPIVPVASHRSSLLHQVAPSATRATAFRQ